MSKQKMTTYKIHITSSNKVIETGEESIQGAMYVLLEHWANGQVEIDAFPPFFTVTSDSAESYKNMLFEIADSLAVTKMAQDFFENSKNPIVFEKKEQKK